jgi:hypothetical protein
MPYFYNTVHVDVRCCARCGTDHEQLRFSEFQGKPVEKSNYWALCPVLDEPILLEVRHKGPYPGVPKGDLQSHDY